jgi:hypothetical protein
MRKTTLTVILCNSTQLMLMMFGIFLAACGADDRAKPGDRVSVTFTGKSNSEYFFTLENPTSRAYYFRGERSLWFATIPIDTGFTCKNDKTGEGTVAGAVQLLDSFSGRKDPPSIELLPGKAIKLRLKTSESGSELAKHQGETCKLHLRLWLPDTPQQRDQLFDSQEFQP